MAEVLMKTDIEREEGFLYFCGTYKKGGKKFLTIGKAKMKHGKSNKKPVKKVAKKKTKKKKRR